jgi:hypothetical protein
LVLFPGLRPLRGFLVIAISINTLSNEQPFILAEAHTIGTWKHLLSFK